MLNLIFFIITETQLSLMLSENIVKSQIQSIWIVLIMNDMIR